MDPATLQKILEVIASGDQGAALALLPEIVKAMASEETAEPAGGADPMAAAAEPPPADPNAPPKPAVAAAKELSPIAKALGCATEEEAAQAVLKLQKSVNDQAASAAAVELEARRGLIARLVKLGIEKPGTAWAKDSKGDPTNTPVTRLSVEPIADMRARVELHEADGPRLPAEAPPTGATVIKLSKAEAEYCKKHGMSEADFQAKKAATVKLHNTKAPK